MNEGACYLMVVGRGIRDVGTMELRKKKSRLASLSESIFYDDLIDDFPAAHTPPSKEAIFLGVKLLKNHYSLAFVAFHKASMFF